VFPREAPVEKIGGRFSHCLRFHHLNPPLDPAAVHDEVLQSLPDLADQLCMVFRRHLAHGRISWRLG
jgi:hypothetical protein